MTSCLKNIPRNELIAVYKNNTSDYYLVGKVESIKKDHLELYEIDTESNWTEKSVIKINEICYVGYDTSYELQLLQNAT